MHKCPRSQESDREERRARWDCGVIGSCLGNKNNDYSAPAIYSWRECGPIFIQKITESIYSWVHNTSVRPLCTDREHSSASRLSSDGALASGNEIKRRQAVAASQPRPFDSRSRPVLGPGQGLVPQLDWGGVQTAGQAALS